MIDLLRKRLWILVIAAFSGLIAGVLFLHVATYKYTAQISVTPIQMDTSSMTNRLSGLASIAGVNLPRDAGSSQFSLFVEGLYTNEVAEVVSRDRDLMAALFPKGWDPAIRDWRPPSGLIAELKSATKETLGFPTKRWRRPGAAELLQYISENVFVSQDPKKTIVSISFSHSDPNVAKQFLSALSRACDETLRRRSLTRATGYIRYLTAKLSTVSQLEHRAALAQAINEQEKTFMIASSGQSFSAEQFGTASVSSVPTSPKPFAILAASPLVGIAFAIGLIIAHQQMRIRRRPNA